MLKKLVLAGLLLVLGLAFGRYWMMQQGPKELVDELPNFEEPGEGPRSPKHRAFGVRLGETDFSQVEALVKQRGIECHDTSVRALMQAKREAKLKELEVKKARGETIDAKSGASWLKRRSPKESNPQIRYACAGVKASQIGDYPRPPAQGRWLFVFDSAKHALRHVSFRRIHGNVSEAIRDFLAAVKALRADFGEPTEIEGDMPSVSSKLARYKATRLEWHYSDVHVKVSILDFGPRGVDVVETVEVPWPVRADAPTLGRATVP